MLFGCFREYAFFSILVGGGHMREGVPQRSLVVWSYTEFSLCNSIPPISSVEPTFFLWPLFFLQPSPGPLSGRYTLKFGVRCSIFGV